MDDDFSKGTCTFKCRLPAPRSLIATWIPFCCKCSWKDLRWDEDAADVQADAAFGERWGARAVCARDPPCVTRLCVVQRPTSSLRARRRSCFSLLHCDFG